MKISIQESRWTPSRINTKELFNKILKAQHRGKTLKASRGGKKTYCQQNSNNTNFCLFKRNHGSQKTME